MASLLQKVSTANCLKVKCYYVVFRGDKLRSVYMQFGHHEDASEKKIIEIFLRQTIYDKLIGLMTSHIILILAFFKVKRRARVK